MGVLMVTPVVRAYLVLQRARERMAAADRRVSAAYAHYQETAELLGVAPAGRQVLAAREDACAAALEEYRSCLGALLADLSTIELRPPF